VSAWRRKAIDQFPELGKKLNDREEVFSINALWFELLSLTGEALREGDENLLRRIYDFAHWCDSQGGELTNAVAVSFYEHLFDARWMRPLVVPWLTQKVIGDIRPLWVARLSSDDMREVDELLRRSKVAAPR
jgi:hypothetical protein